jgi:hypothetical protein
MSKIKHRKNAITMMYIKIRQLASITVDGIVTSLKYITIKNKELPKDELDITLENIRKSLEANTDVKIKLLKKIHKYNNSYKG